MKIKSILLSVLIFFFAVFAVGIVWVNRPLGMDGSSSLLLIKKKTVLSNVIHEIERLHPHTPAIFLYAWFRASGQSRGIKAGLYQISAQDTPYTLLLRLTHGDTVPLSITLIEGWTFSQVRHALDDAPYLEHKTKGMSDQQIMQLLDPFQSSAEGQVFPDTYQYTAGDSDMDILRRAHDEMNKNLDIAWNAKQQDLPLSTKQDVLIMASLVEKETANAADRPMVAAVLENRIKIGMRLQTDPAVIYGMKDRYDGRITRTDLDRDTPWNTYTRSGLPPTPIAIPGKAALMATVQPAKTNALYFVASKDGRTIFSTNLQSHNRAVQQYILDSSRPSP